MLWRPAAQVVYERAALPDSTGNLAEVIGCRLQLGGQFFLCHIGEHDDLAAGELRASGEGNRLPVANGEPILLLHLRRRGQYERILCRLRKHDGATVDVLGWYGISAGSGQHMGSLPASSSYYADGTYDADLVIDNRRRATTTFTIGGAAAVSVKVSAFYSVDPSVYSTWASKGYPTPQQVNWYHDQPPQQVPFYVRYSGAKPQVTLAWVEVVRLVGGSFSKRSTTTFTSTAYPLAYASGAIMIAALPAPDHVFPAGTYDADLHMGQKAIKTTQFVVGDIVPSGN